MFWSQIRVCLFFLLMLEWAGYKTEKKRCQTPQGFRFMKYCSVLFNQGKMQYSCTSKLKNLIQWEECLSIKITHGEPVELREILKHRQQKCKHFCYKVGGWLHLLKHLTGYCINFMKQKQLLFLCNTKGMKMQ